MLGSDPLGVGRWGLITMETKWLVRMGLCMSLALSYQSKQVQAPSQTQASQQLQSQAAAEQPSVPRGKKLCLKDGTFQLVREYKTEGDRVRYYSLDSLQWEEIPASMVDWDATKKLETEEEHREEAIIAKARGQEQARQAEPLDIDASLEVAPGVFLPPGEGLFAFDGKSVFQLSQAETGSKINKGQVLKQILVPVPVIPTRHTISIKKAHATFRLKQSQPEFYMRTADAREPEMELIHAKVRGETRQIENVDELFKLQREKADTMPLQRWEVARGVYRFTLGRSLDPGEYAFAEIVQGTSMSLYMWDFGIDAASDPAGSLR